MEGAMPPHCSTYQTFTFPTVYILSWSQRKFQRQTTKTLVDSYSHNPFRAKTNPTITYNLLKLWFLDCSIVSFRVSLVILSIVLKGCWKQEDLRSKPVVLVAKVHSNFYFLFLIILGEFGCMVVFWCVRFC